MNNLNWNPDITQDPSIPPINWTALQDYALDLRRTQCQNPSITHTCHIPPIYHKGGLHLVRLLSFNDDTTWIARIQLHECTPSSRKHLFHEIHTLSIIREQTDIPVPEVFGYDSSGEIIGRAFMIMEFIPGSTAMDSFGGWKVHNGEIPSEYKESFLWDTARIQVAMSSIRFPKIGMITKREDGSYDIDAIPDLGGPFTTATEYFAAWADTVTFPMSETDMRACLPPHLEDEVIASIQHFPDQLKENLSKIIIRNEGPFPLYHPDFLHSNIIIDGNYKILSIIDWEHAGTVPWEVVEFPLFLYTVPPPMDLPSKYDSDGNPLDEGVRLQWEERNGYVRSVREAEGRLGCDKNLSGMLALRSSQNLATALKLYVDPGKLGFYCRVLDELFLDTK